jgi:hypothetical protein
MINKYREEKINRYIELNQLVDKLVNRVKDETETYISLYNKYQNEFFLRSTRKKTKKSEFKGVINSRIKLQ